MELDEFLRIYPVRALQIMWFLGAGASASACIPTAWELPERAAGHHQRDRTAHLGFARPKCLSGQRFEWPWIECSASGPGLGTAYLFPAPGSPDRPITKDTAERWLAEAEKLAKLPHLERGGWAGTETLVRCYQRADDATMLAVVLGGGQLRGKQA